MNRRHFLNFTAGSALLAVAAPLLRIKDVFAMDNATDAIKKITKADAEWKKELPPESYDVLRHEGTERAFTSPLNDEKRAGIFACKGCGLALFPSTFKFNSGTGWPSFFDVIPGHIETKTDFKIIAARTEYHCAQCGGHQGHVFNDGPEPTGLRYCNNGVALTFVPDANAKVTMTDEEWFDPANKGCCA